MPDEQVLILDEDELAAARDAGLVSEKEYDGAYTTLKDLRESGFFEVSRLTALSERIISLF